MIASKNFWHWPSILRGCACLARIELCAHLHSGSKILHNKRLSWKWFSLSVPNATWKLSRSICEWDSRKVHDIAKLAVTRTKFWCSTNMLISGPTGQALTNWGCTQHTTIDHCRLDMESSCLATKYWHHHPASVWGRTITYLAKVALTFELMD